MNSVADLYTKYDIENELNQELQNKTISDTEIESIKKAFAIAYSLSKCSLQKSTECNILNKRITNEMINTSINFLNSYTQKNENEEFKRDLQTILTFLQTILKTKKISGGTRKNKKKPKRKQSKHRYHKKKSIYFKN